ALSRSESRRASILLWRTVVVGVAPAFPHEDIFAGDALVDAAGRDLHSGSLERGAVPHPPPRGVRSRHRLWIFLPLRWHVLADLGGSDRSDPRWATRGRESVSRVGGGVARDSCLRERPPGDPLVDSGSEPLPGPLPRSAQRTLRALRSFSRLRCAAR